MAIAKGVAKKVAYKKETAWGVLATGSGAKYIRRVTSNFNLTKETYESAEIRTDYQVADFRHGIRSVDGTINGELSPGTYSDFHASVLARDWTAVTALTGVSVTIAASGSLFTVTRTAGSFITDNISVGNVVILTGAGLNAANQSNNLLVITVSALVLTVKVLSSTPLIPEGPITPVGIAVRGKVTFAPVTGHTDDSYTVEEWYSDIAQSEVYSGAKVGSVATTLPTTGLVTTDITFMGKDRAVKGTTQYFTTPTAAGTNGIFASVSGALVVNGVPSGLVTGMDFTIDRGLEGANVIGQDTMADVFTGRIRVTGNFSVYFQDAVARDVFDNESVITLVVALATGKEKNADVMTFTIPRVKVGSADKADAEMGIIQSHSFVGLLNSDVSAGLANTTISLNDTTLV